jgi:hypothetical protein
VKIIGEATDTYAQGYYYYDSKKAGTVTVSHLRFGKSPIRSQPVERANFVACHKFSFLEKVDMLGKRKEGAVFLLASPFDKDSVWENIPSRSSGRSSTEDQVLLHHALKIADEIAWATGSTSYANRFLSYLRRSPGEAGDRIDRESITIPRQEGRRHCRHESQAVRAAKTRSKVTIRNRPKAICT